MNYTTERSYESLRLSNVVVYSRISKVTRFQCEVSQMIVLIKTVLFEERLGKRGLQLRRTLVGDGIGENRSGRRISKSPLTTTNLRSVREKNDRYGFEMLKIRRKRTLTKVLMRMRMKAWRIRTIKPSFSRSMPQNDRDNVTSKPLLSCYFPFLLSCPALSTPRSVKATTHIVTTTSSLSYSPSGTNYL
jgi:hypothetical protein